MTVIVRRHGGWISFAAAILLSIPSPIRAGEIFEKAGGELPVSPTGMSWSASAPARAAGWTIAAPESRLSFMGRNPAFLAGQSRWAVALAGDWEHREVNGTGIRSDANHLRSATGRLRLASIALGFAYQLPDAIGYEFETIYRRRIAYEESFETWSGAIAFEPSRSLAAGASIALLEIGLGARSMHAYQATIGAELERRAVGVAAAFQSEPFGGDAAEMLAPSWLHVDARLPLGQRWTLAARLSAGWWNRTRHGVLRAPIDAGAGASCRIASRLRLLAGVHNVRRRHDLPPDVEALFGRSPLIRRGQGTFLDGGVLIDLPGSHLALSVEDNHIDADAPSTVLTLAAGARF